MSVTSIFKNKPVEGLSPQLESVELLGPGDTYAVRGKCGFNGLATHCIFNDKAWCFEPVCNCPLHAILTA